jgi:hypothetical protein
MLKAAVPIACLIALGQDQQPQKLPEPPGRLVDIGGRRLHLHCTGQGSLTVVLIADANVFVRSRRPRLERCGCPPTCSPCGCTSICGSGSAPIPRRPDSTLSWRQEFLRLFEETASGKKPPLDIPVIVLSSGPAGTQADRESRTAAAGRLDFLSGDSLHIIADGSGHEIHLYRPDLVVQAVVQAVSAVRNRVPVSGR